MDKTMEQMVKIIAKGHVILGDIKIHFEKLSERSSDAYGVLVEAQKVLEDANELGDCPLYVMDALCALIDSFEKNIPEY